MSIRKFFLKVYHILEFCIFKEQQGGFSGSISQVLPKRTGGLALNRMRYVWLISLDEVKLCFLPRESNLIFIFWNNFFNGPQNKVTGFRGCGENLIHFYFKKKIKHLKQQFLTQLPIISLNLILNNSSLRANIKSVVQRW